MKNDQLKDELKFVEDLVKLIKKNSLNSIEVKRSFSEFENINIKINGEKTREITVQKGEAVTSLSSTAKPEEIIPTDFLTQPEFSKKGSLVSSPMVGTVYLAPSPEEKDFVEIGQKVKKGDTLLIIEAMKTMNPIPSTFDGVIKEVLVSNDTPVEFGTPLVVIE